MIHVTLKNGETLLYEECECLFILNFYRDVEIITGIELLAEFPKFVKPHYVMKNRFENGPDSPIVHVRKV